MKLFLVYFAILALIFGFAVSKPNPLGFALKASDEDLQKFIDALKKFSEDGDASAITSLDIINDLTDDLLNNVKTRMAEAELDVVKLRNETIDITADGEEGSLNLSNGELQNLTATLRDEDVTVESEDEILRFIVPLSYKELVAEFTFTGEIDTNTVEGNIKEKIDDVHINVSLTYEAENGFQVEDLELEENGEITVEAGTDFDETTVNTILISLQAIIEGVTVRNVRIVAKEVAKAINEFIQESKK